MKDDVLNIAIIPGIENGVGPELILKALNALNYKDKIAFFWFLDRTSLVNAAKNSRLSLDFIDQNTGLLEKKLKLKFLNEVPIKNLSKRAAFALKKTVEMSNKFDAIVSGPIEKSLLKYLGNFNGQTEYFAKHLGLKDEKPFMAFMGAPFILSLFTTHISLKEVAQKLSKEALLSHFFSLNKVLSQLNFGKKILVLGLNPHAGESGLIGHEEKDIIKPAILKAKKMGLNIDGPVSADGFFAYFHKLKKTDYPSSVVSMYHDQGLTAYKLLAKAKAVNVTFGLKIPRTSPAHGTATSLVGKNLACHKSSLMALKLAIKLAKKFDN